MNANESAAPLPQAEEESSDGRMSLAIGTMTILKRTTSIWKTKNAGDDHLCLDESMDITTVMGFHKRGDEESSVQEDSCGRTILAVRNAPVCQLEIEIKGELESHDTERER